MSFLQAMQKKNTVTQNSALSNSSTGNSVLDYFAKCGSYRSRSQSEVTADIDAAYSEDSQLALKTIFYNRAITRKSKGFDESDNVIKGQGNKDEFIRAIKALEEKHPKTLYVNLWLIPTLGCWKDLWYDSVNTGLYHYVNKTQVYKLIKMALKNDYHRALLAKYLPKIRSASNTKTDRHRRLNDFAKGLCKYLNWTERDYRKFKSNPEFLAHQFQRDISAGNWTDIDWNMVPGKALFNLATIKGKDGKTFVERHGLEASYTKWLAKQPVAKFTGYVYELGAQVKHSLNAAQKMTINKQFEGLLALAKDNLNPELLEGGVLCALDTSGSMTYTTAGKNTAYDICVSLGVYFASLIQGHFHNHVVHFGDTSKLVKLNHDNFVDNYQQITGSTTAWGSTNFQSVIDEIVRVRNQNPKIPVNEYPKVLLVVSDMQFNPTAGNTQTNYEVAMKKLRAVGLEDMTVVWWQVNGSYGNDFPSSLDDAGTVLVSGFDGSIVSSILGGAKEQVVDAVTGEVRRLNPLEMMTKCLDQEVLNKIVVVD